MTYNNCFAFKHLNIITCEPTGIVLPFSVELAEHSYQLCKKHIQLWLRMLIYEQKIHLKFKNVSFCIANFKTI